MRLLTLVLYAAAASAYLTHFARRDRPSGRMATALLVAAAVAHAYLIGLASLQTGDVPAAGTAAVTWSAWLLALAYLSTEIATDDRAVGAFVMPLVVLLLVAPTVDPGVAAARPEARAGAVVAVQAVAVASAYACFALAGMVAVAYVLLFREIKARRPGYFYGRLPPLQAIDRMNMRAATLGWTCLTVGLAAGATGWLAADASASAGAGPVRDPAVLLSIAAWCLYSFQQVARRVWRWGPRRSAYLSVVGLAVVLLAVLPVAAFQVPSGPLP